MNRGARGEVCALVNQTEFGRVDVGLLEVVAEDLVELDQIGAALLEPLGEAPVQLDPDRLWKCFIGGIPDEEVPEPEPVVAGQLCPGGRLPKLPVRAFRAE